MSAIKTRLFDSCRPRVLAGDTLAIAVDQSLAAPGYVVGSPDTSLLDVQQPDVVNVEVQGPRYLLGPADILGQYPAPGSKDSPADFLPHVALSRRTLPWERRGAIAGTPPLPWLALLLVRESELSDAGPGTAPGAAVQRMTVDELKPAHPGIHDQLTAQSSTGGTPFAGSDQIHVAWLSSPLLAEILPFASELPLLCHMKRVIETADGDPNATVPLSTADTAIVIGNRLPTVPSTGPPEVHTALLVSLERRGDLYTSFGAPNQGTPGKPVSVPLVVLHHWSFTTSSGGDFEQAMQEIRLRPNGGVLRFGNLPADAEQGVAAPLSGGFQALLDRGGYPATPLKGTQHRDVAYRGPLRPVPPKPRSAGFAIRAAPEEFDPADGQRHDVSYAAAFELGRLLALHDEGILEDLHEVRSYGVWNGPTLTRPPLDVDIPAVLGVHEWVKGDIDWRAQPWDMNLDPAEPMTVIKDHDALHVLAGTADPLRMQAIAAFQAVVQDRLAKLTAPNVDLAASIAIGTIEPAGLAQQFPHVQNAGKSAP